MQIVFSSSIRYYLHGGAVDMRKGFDSLSGLVTEHFQLSAMSGHVFIFINAHRNLIKLLHWQGDGFAIFHKRLERGTYELPKQNNHSKTIQLTHHQLQFILDGIVLSGIKKRRRYEHLIVDKS